VTSAVVLREILDRLMAPTRIGATGLIASVRITEHQHMTVAWLLETRCGDAAACAGNVLDEKGLPEGPWPTFGEKPRQHVPPDCRRGLRPQSSQPDALARRRPARLRSQQAETRAKANIAEVFTPWRASPTLTLRPQMSFWRAQPPAGVLLLHLLRNRCSGSSLAKPHCGLTARLSRSMARRVLGRAFLSALFSITGVCSR